MNHIKYI